MTTEISVMYGSEKVKKAYDFKVDNYLMLQKTK